MFFLFVSEMMNDKKTAVSFAVERRDANDGKLLCGLLLFSMFRFCASFYLKSDLYRWQRWCISTLQLERNSKSNEREEDTLVTEEDRFIRTKQFSGLFVCVCVLAMDLFSVVTLKVFRGKLNKISLTVRNFLCLL